MAARIRVVRRAERQLEEASGWWRENRPAAPDLLRQEVERAFLLISSQPAVGAPARDSGLEGVRRLHLIRIHYDLYYRVRNDGAIEVLAFWHTSRGRGPEL